MFRRATKTLTLLSLPVIAHRLYRLSSPAPPPCDLGRRTIAAVGDSNTFGFGVLLKRRATNSYPAQLERLLNAEYQVLNYGLNSRTLLSTGDRPYIEHRFYRISRVRQPDVVLIMLGTNDSKWRNWNPDRFRADLRELAVSYRDLGNRPAVFLLTPPAVYKNAAGIRSDVIREEVIPMIFQVGTELDLPVIDVHSATTCHPELFPDGVHGNAAGYELIAQAVGAHLM